MTMFNKNKVGPTSGTSSGLKANIQTSQLSSIQDESLLLPTSCEDELFSLYTKQHAVFRPLTKEQSLCCPPLYRDTASLSRDFYTMQLSSLSSSSSICAESEHRKPMYQEEDTQNLPIDFVPPRHNFGTTRSSSTSGSVERLATTSRHYEAVELRPDDIICGHAANFHPGNQAYQKLIKEYSASYRYANQREKVRTVMEILDIIKSLGVRFIKRKRVVDYGLIWVEINETRAYEKIRKNLLFYDDNRHRRIKMDIKENDCCEVTEDAINRRGFQQTMILFEDESLFFQRSINSPVILKLM